MSDDDGLIDRLRRGDEAAFAELIDRYHASMVRVATTVVGSRAVAEEVAQDTWIGVVRGIDRFEGRSSLRTWLFRILVNRARSAGGREWRTATLPLDDSTVDPARFGADGHWTQPPEQWADDVVDRLAAAAYADPIRAAVEALPPGQRAVVTLRDIDGLAGPEVCDILGITASNQRVLLHRGRAAVRAALAPLLTEEAIR